MLKYRKMIKIIIVVGLLGVFMDTARCSPLAFPQSENRPLDKLTADDPMKMMDAPLKNMVHQEGKIHRPNKNIWIAIIIVKTILHFEYLVLILYFVIILTEEARSDCGGGCFNVRNCYLQACKKCPRCRHWTSGEHVDGKLS